MADPPLKGGSINTLIYEGLILENEKQGNPPYKFIVLSEYDKEAEQEAKKLNNSEVIYYKIPRFVKTMDRFAYSLTGKKKAALKDAFSTLYFLRKVKKLLLKNDYDAVIVESSMVPLRPFKKKKIAMKYQGKLYYHAHNPLWNLRGNEEVVDNLAGFISVSQETAERSKRILGHDKFPPVKILYNFVDHSLFKPLEPDPSIRKRYGLSQDDFVVLFAGRLSEQKGIDLLLKAFKTVVKKYPYAKLLVAGSSLYKDAAKSQFELALLKDSEELSDNIIFTGYVDHSGMPKLYNASDLACLPSIHSEAAGLTMLEAISCGRPLITTDIGGIPEYMGDGALLLKVDDKLEENIAKAIIELKENEGERLELARKGLERSQQFPKSRYYLDFQKIFGL